MTGIKLLALYFCHFSRNGVRFDDPTGFDADDHDEAIEVARAIAAIIIEGDPHAADVMVELQIENGEVIISSVLSALVSDLH